MIAKQILKAGLFTMICLVVSVAGADESVVTVKLKDFKFIPDDLTVKVGTTVRWINEEKRQYHSVWFRDAGDPVSDYFFPGETYQRTFDKPGVYPYVCEPHEVDSKMVGRVRVVP